VKTSRIIFLLAVLARPVLAQSEPKKLPEAAIEDNSFFIEEAYNQEAGVVQHINTLALFGTDHRNVFYTFTQEWPVVSQRHQASFTLPYTHLEAGLPSGFGDVMLNYRYQLGAFGRRWAMAPRLSLVLPTGAVTKAMGYGTLGVQVNLPYSVRIGRELVTHWNAGATILPRAQVVSDGGSRIHHALTSYNVGGSFIGPVTSPVQFMLETTASFNQAFNETGGVTRATVTTVSPGIRAAINVGGLQIVPGVAFPIVSTGGSSETDVFFYLSFEHAFSHPTEGSK
jgi:hypothetical protein